MAARLGDADRRANADNRPVSARERIAPAAATMAVALAAGLWPSGAVARDPLQFEPDLRTLQPTELVVEFKKKQKRVVLRFSNEVANHGDGPLEIRPETATTTDCNGDGIGTDRVAYQRIYQDGNGNNRYDPGFDTGYTETAVGCKIFHPAHDHWHLDRFARYELIREKTGKVVASSTKVSFCLLDSDHAYESANLPGDPGASTYNATCRELDRQGISAGWGDRYSFALPGQGLTVTGLPAARYCLVSTANPVPVLTETNYANNAAERRLWLNPAKRRVHSLLHQRCRSGI